MTREESIMARVHEHLDESFNYFPADRIVGLFLQGSQNYGLDYEKSDVDTKLIVTPTFKEIAFNHSPVNTTHVRANDEHTELITTYLKERNMGYTVLAGYGSKDKMNMVFIVLARKETPKVLKEIRALCDNKVFVVASEVSKYAGGYGMIK